MAGLSAYQPSPENLLVNGDFGLEILDGGFDWMHQKTRGVTLALDPNETHSSARSLRIIFDGPGIEDAGILPFSIPEWVGLFPVFGPGRGRYSTADSGFRRVRAPSRPSHFC